MEKHRTGIVDSPLQKNEDDKLQMQSFEIALTEFIENTATPISIALQGEWGSGKTSLMNRLDKQLCEDKNKPYYGIWLNTWHYALMNDSKTILFGIINALINDVLDISKKEHPEKLKSLIKDVYNVGKSILKGISKVAVKTAVSQINDGAADAIDEAVFTEKGTQEHNLSDLRNKLGELITELINKNKETGIKKTGLVFFIDDLDRIEPSLAVKILELLKNIFEIDHCIFVLAIDYEVVVKGLKDKFGELNAQNEREFRSFFDKIIQLPFQMPLNTYVIDDYINEMLVSVGFITESETDMDFIQSLVQFTNLSVGSNPRSIKRLANTLSFINLLIKSRNSLTQTNQKLAKYEKQLIFGLTCLQTAFSGVFNLLAENPNIENWTDEFAKKQNIESYASRNNSITELNLNEKWKQILFMYCNKSSYLKRSFFNIVSIINEMQLVAENNARGLSQVLPEIIELLSVTSIHSRTKPRIDINNIRVMYAINKKLLPALQSKLKSPLKIVERKGRMIAKLSYKFDEEKQDNWISVFVYVKFNNIYVKVGNEIGLFTVNEASDAIQNIESLGKTEVFNQIIANYNELNQKYSSFSFVNKPGRGMFVEKQKQKFQLYFQSVADNLEYLYTDKFINELSNFIIDFMLRSYELKNTDWKAR